MVGDDPLQRRPQTLVDLDQVDARGPRGEPLGQHPLPAADLQDDVAGVERRVGDDRLQQVGVGEEVLA